MGCNSCKEVAVNPAIIAPPKVKSLDDVDEAGPEDTTIRERSSRLVEANNYQKPIENQPLYNSNKDLKRPQSMELSPWTNSNNVTKCHPTSNGTRSAKVTTVRVSPEINSNTTSDKLNKHDISNQQNANTTSNDSNVIMRPAAVRPIVVESIQSMTSEDDRGESGFSYDDVVSSSSSANTEKTMLRQNTLVRFTSAKVTQSKLSPETFSNDLANDFEESFPLRDSFTTSILSDREESSTQEEEDALPLTPYGTQTSNIQENNHTTDISNESDSTDLHFQRVTHSSTSYNSEVIRRQRNNVNKSTSSNQTKSDSHQNPTNYETSSESYQF